MKSNTCHSKRQSELRPCCTAYCVLTTYCRFGLDIQVPGATILSTFGFDSLAFWNDACGLGIFAGVFIVLAYAAMHLLLVERR